MTHLPMSAHEYALIASIAQQRGVTVESVVKQLLTEAVISRIVRSLPSARVALVVPFRRRFEA